MTHSLTTKLVAWIRARPALVFLAIVLVAGASLAKITEWQEGQAMTGALQTVGFTVRNLERTSVGFSIQIIGDRDEVLAACEAARTTVASKRLGNPMMPADRIYVSGSSSTMNVQFGSTNGGACVPF